MTEDKKITLNGHTIILSHLDKPYFPVSGITKGDLIDYYRRIAHIMLPCMAGRPVMMHRFPEGIGGEDFYHKDVPDYFPDWIHGETIRKEGGTLDQLICENAATVVYIANQGCITPHIWLSRVGKPP